MNKEERLKTEFPTLYKTSEDLLVEKLIMDKNDYEDLQFIRRQMRNIVEKDIQTKEENDS